MGGAASVTRFSLPIATRDALRPEACFGYGLAVPPGRSAATIQPKMTLGALYRCLLDRLDTPFGLRVGIHFEERTSIVVEDAAAGTEPTRIEQRTYDADLTRARRSGGGGRR